MNQILASIILFGGNFEILGWAFCDGRIMSIASNTALFSLLGTTYGGDGRTTFALPNLNSRVAIGAGQGRGLPSYDLGQAGGANAVAVLMNEMPAHSHQLHAFQETGNSNTPNNNLLANSGTNDPEFRAAGTMVQMSADSVSITGGSQAFDVMQPVLSLNYLIALQGIYPSRP